MPRFKIFRSRSKGRNLVIRVSGKRKDKAESEKTTGLDSLRNIGAIISPASSTRYEDEDFKIEWQDTVSVSSDSFEENGHDRYTSVFQSPIKPSNRSSVPTINPDFIPNPLHRQPRRLQMRLDLPQGKYSKNKIQQKQGMVSVERRDNDQHHGKLGLHPYREGHREPAVLDRLEKDSVYANSGIDVDTKTVAVVSPLSDDNISNTLGMKNRPNSDDQNDKIKLNTVNSILKNQKRTKKVHFLNPMDASDGAAGKQGSVDCSGEGSHIPAEYVFTFESSEVSDEDDITFHSTRSPIRLQQECKDLEAACSTFNGKLQRRAQNSKPYQLISRSLSCLKDRGHLEQMRNL